MRSDKQQFRPDRCLRQEWFAGSYTFILVWTITFLAAGTLCSPASAVMTISRGGDGMYGIAETVRFTGMNTDDFTTYLFITGPGLDANGVTLTNSRLRAIDGFFTEAAVDPLDRTWTYDWVPQSLQSENLTGTYTVYAVGSPLAHNALTGVVHGSTTIVLGKPPAPTTASTPAPVLTPALTETRTPAPTQVPVSYGTTAPVFSGTPVGTTITVWPGTAVFVTKTVSPATVFIGEAAAINITINNPTTLLFSEVEVTDTLSGDFTVTGGTGGTSFQYLRPGESHTIGYTIRATKAGNFPLQPATVRVRDFRGNYHTIRSGSPGIVVLPTVPVTENPVTQAPGFEAVCSMVVLGFACVFVAVSGRPKP